MPHAYCLISLCSLPHTSCVYFPVQLIPNSPCACLHAAAEGSSQTTEEIALLACLSYLISTLKNFPSFNPCALNSLRVSRKPHPLVPPKTSEVQGLISLEYHAGKQHKSVHAADSALLLLLLSLLSDVSLLTELLLRELVNAGYFIIVVLFGLIAWSADTCHKSNKSIKKLHNWQN